MGARVGGLSVGVPGNTEAACPVKIHLYCISICISFPLMSLYLGQRGEQDEAVGAGLCSCERFCPCGRARGARPGREAMPPAHRALSITHFGASQKRSQELVWSRRWKKHKRSRSENRGGGLDDGTRDAGYRLFQRLFWQRRLRDCGNLKELRSP